MFLNLCCCPDQAIFDLHLHTFRRVKMAEGAGGSPDELWKGLAQEMETLMSSDDLTAETVTDKLLNASQIAAWAAQGAHSPGLGKTAIAEGLALHIIKGGIPLSTA